MCDVCGCGDTSKVTVQVHRSLLEANDHEAAHLREHYARHGVTAINLMGSPGSGKTALLEATARSLGSTARLSAVSGDLATTLDADRLELAGVPSWPITTGTGCHLDAALIHHALHEVELAQAVRLSDFFFIENVGNLVCPAIYDLGQQANVVALAVTEGIDKPLKYPVMFERADLVVLTKVDLLPHLRGVSLLALRENIEQVHPNVPVLAVSAETGEGMEGFCAWLSHLGSAPPPRARVEETTSARERMCKAPWKPGSGVTDPSSAS